MQNNSCYYYKYINQKNGIFENTVDAIFILLMENSIREKNIIKQLMKYNLHSNIIIQYNKGYKLCNKNLYKYKSNYDLLDAVNQVFTYALYKKYENILVLEDDFILTEKIKNNKYIEKLNKFIKFNNFNIISLGSISFSYNKLIDEYFYKCFLLADAHAIIYNKKSYNIFKNNYKDNNLIHVDYDFTIYNDVYLFKEYLIIQQFTKTDNFNNWPLIIRLGFNLINSIYDIDWDNIDELQDNWNKYVNLHIKINNLFLHFNDKFIINTVIFFTVLYFYKFEKNIYNCSKLTQLIPIFTFFPLKKKLKYSNMYIKSFFYFIYTWHFLHTITFIQNKYKYKYKYKKEK